MEVLGKMCSKDERLNCERQTLQDKYREFQKLLIIKTYTAGKVERTRYSRKRLPGGKTTAKPHQLLCDANSETKDCYLHSLNGAGEHRGVGDIFLVQ